MNQVSSKTIKRRPNSDIEAGYLKQQKQQELNPVTKQVNDAPEQQFRSISEKVAQSNVCVLNWVFPGAREEFPLEPRMRSVKKYFPYAKGGPLLIDEPQRADEIAQCERRAKILAKLGFRYLIIKAGMNEIDCQFELERKVN